jgi:hypothetical protein
MLIVDRRGGFEVLERLLAHTKVIITVEIAGISFFLLNQTLRGFPRVQW